MKKILFIVEFALLLLCIACGSGSGSGGTFIKSQGSFSRASLSGQYAYQLSGTNGSDLAEAGIFAADGNGNITSGTDDFVQGTGSSLGNTVTGTYTVGNDGTGFLNLTISGQQVQFAMAMVNSSKVYLSESDGTANASGVAQLQSASAMATAPSGTFTFRFHNPDTAQGPVASVGMFTLAAGTLSTGSEDVLLGGVTSSLTLTSGAFNAPASGRGSGTLVDSNGTLSFEYYVIDGNHLIILPVSVVGIGSAEMQTGGPFNPASLSGNYAFGGKGGILSTGAGSVQVAGMFSADGNGGIVSGLQDVAQNGTTAASDTFSGSYTVSPAGRVDVNLSSAALGNVHEIFWLVNSSRAFFLVDDASTIEDGTIDTQQSTTFTNASLSGQFGLSMSGLDFNAGNFVDRLGALNLDGNGKLTLDLAEIDTGGLTNVGLSGTYTVASNGRTTATINSLSNNIIFYPISGNDAYVIQSDQNVEIGGTMSKQ